MESETANIFKEQLLKLPPEVVAFLSSVDWNDKLDEIGSLYNLNEDQLFDLKQETALVLAGLMHPDDFFETLKDELDLRESIIEAVSDAVEEKIFASVRAALVDFVEKEEAEINATQTDTTPSTTASTEPTSTQTTTQKQIVVPENLPTGPIPEHLIPPIPPKMEAVIAPVPPKVEQDELPGHPFEEKMKLVFTAGESTADNLVLTPVAPTAMADTFVPPPPPASPQQQTPSVPPPARHADPYREPIE